MRLLGFGLLMLTSLVTAGFVATPIYFHSNNLIAPTPTPIIKKTIIPVDTVKGGFDPLIVLFAGLALFGLGFAMNYHQDKQEREERERMERAYEEAEEGADEEDG